MALCVCGNGNDILWDPVSPRHRHHPLPLSRPLFLTINPAGYYVVIDSFFVAHLNCNDMGSSWSPGESSGVHGGYKGGWVGGGPHGRWGSFCQHWERVNIEESWVSSLDRGGKRCQWAGKLSSPKIVSIQNRARVGQGQAVENKLVIGSSQIFSNLE